MKIGMLHNFFRSRYHVSLEILHKAVHMAFKSDNDCMVINFSHKFKCLEDYFIEKQYCSNLDWKEWQVRNIEEGILSEELCNVDYMIGFEMPPSICNVLDRHNIVYINFFTHPVRFCPDLLWAVATNSKCMAGKLCKWNYPYEDNISNFVKEISMQSVRWQVEYLPFIGEGTTVIFGQTENDSSILNKGEYVSLLDYCQEIKNLTNDSRNILIVPHPNAKCYMDLLKLIEFLGRGAICNFNSYALLCNKNVDHIITLSSSLGIESKFFDKKVSFLLGPALRNGGSMVCENDFLYTVGQEIQHDDFWQALFLCKSIDYSCGSWTFTYKNFYRNILGGWSYSTLQDVLLSESYIIGYLGNNDLKEYSKVGVSAKSLVDIGRIKFNSKIGRSFFYTKGMQFENGYFVSVTKNVKIMVYTNKNIVTKGITLEIEPILLKENAVQHILVNVNGYDCGKYILSTPVRYQLNLPGNILVKNDRECEIDIRCENAVSPKTLGVGDDVRDLSFKIYGLNYTNYAVSIPSIVGLDNTKEEKVFMHRVKEKCFPAGSKRWILGKLLQKLIKSPRFMISKINKNNIKKLFYYYREDSLDELIERIELHVPNDTPVEKFFLFSSEEANSIEEVDQLSFPSHEAPCVSIIIPVYNQFSYTYNCLKAILKHSGDVSYEVIVADDCSNDNIKILNSVVNGIKIIRNQSNLRFLLNCNNAAQYARGRYILFLNNDTQVQPDWLKPMLDVMESCNEVGIVGSKLVYPDGRLQEAGSILWDDGSAWNYGNRCSSSKPEYNYVKEVDYISGASIMIRKNLWEQIGGFDERYVPAYCEDSDLAFEIRKAGYKVVYQPKSVVVHFEGISNGKDLKKGVKKYQVVNAQKFYDKWKTVLEQEHFPNGEDVFWARDRSWKKKTVVVIDHYIPTFDKDAGSRTVYQYIKCLVRLGYNVKLIGDNFFRMEPYTTVFENIGVEVLVGSYYAKNWKKWFKANSKYIDFVFLNRPHISMKYIDFIKQNTKAKILYYVQDLHFLREYREYELTGNDEFKKESERWKKIEVDIMSKADVNFTISEDEKKIMNELVPGEKAAVMPVFAYSGLKQDSNEIFEKKNILFVGGFNHRPNEDAVLWFVDKVWPKFKSQYPESEFIVAGSNPTKKIRDISCPGVVVTGYISDEELENYYSSCKVCVIPLRYGAGVKGKTIEAMYNGIGIVSTSIGIEGLVDIEKYISPHNDEDSFLNEMEKMYTDNLYRKNKVDMYRQYISENFLMNTLEGKIKKYFS